MLITACIDFARTSYIAMQKNAFFANYIHCNVCNWCFEDVLYIAMSQKEDGAHRPLLVTLLKPAEISHLSKIILPLIYNTLASCFDNRHNVFQNSLRNM